MAFEGEAVAENALYYHEFVFFCASLCHDLLTLVSAVHRCYRCSYIVVATITIELLRSEIFDKKKKKRRNKKEQIMILLLASFVP